MKRTFTFFMAMIAICSLQIQAQSITTTYIDPTTGLVFTLQDSKAQTGKKVAMIVADAVAYKSMTEITIPPSVKRMTGKTSFEEYRVVGISANAFKNNTSIKKVTLGEDAVIQMGKSAFQGCTALEEVNLAIHWSSSLTTAMRVALLTNFVKEITVGKTVMYELLPSVFEGCTSLKTVKLSLFHTKIGKNAFKDCSALESINLDGLVSLTTLDDYAFAGCSSLENIFIGSNVETFGLHVFEGCTALSYVEWEASSVADFTAPDGTNPSPFYDLRDNESLEIENLGTMTRVPAYFCYGVKNILGACALEEIGAHAYEGCTNMQFKTIALNNVKKIEEAAFNGPEFIRVELPATPPVIFDENVFGDARNTAQFYINDIDCDANAAYLADANWSKFNIEVLGGMGTPKTEMVVLDEHPTGAGTSMSTPGPGFTVYATCTRPEFTAVMREGNDVATCWDADDTETKVPFGYFEYKGEKYYTHTVTLTMTNPADVLKIVYTADVPDALDNMKAGKAEYKKVIRNGQLLILRNGKTYNILGAETE